MSEALAFKEIHSRLLRHQTEEYVGELGVDGDWYLFAGMETQPKPAQDYFWHGLKRGGDPAYPYIVFQYTLDGRGAFEFEDKEFALHAGDVFVSLVPSDHKYYVPNDSNLWTFFWLTIYHPYIVSRLTKLIASAGPVFSIPPETRLLSRSLTLWEELQSTTSRDLFSREQSLFDWMFEFERYCNGLLYPQAERDHWLNDVRSIVLSNLSRPCDVEELAVAQGLSRSHFSHRFKTATGLSPAAWVQQIRLDEVARRLARTDDKLEKIARDVGLGDANHLCKVFRRRFHLSPGEFRRQMK